MLVLQLAEHVFVGQSTIGISLLKLETPYADPHVRYCERCDAKTSAYSISGKMTLLTAAAVSSLEDCLSLGVREEAVELLHLGVIAEGLRGEGAALHHE